MIESDRRARLLGATFAQLARRLSLVDGAPVRRGATRPRLGHVPYFGPKLTASRKAAIIAIDS